MSLVGTRPPTVDEWDKYELHHRARLATKPGLTGMWQVSGRSNITDLTVWQILCALILEEMPSNQMGSMLQYVAIISFAVGMGGMLEKLGVLEHILNAVVKRINSDGSMILVTLIVGYITSLISCSQPMSHVLTGRLMAPVFKERKVAPEILSRCLEDSGTMAGPMIPWHGYGVYMAGTLGVAWAAFFPYLFLLYLTPIFSIIYGFTGISIKHVSGEEVAE